MDLVYVDPPDPHISVTRSYRDFHHRDGLDTAKAQAAKQYCDVIYWLEMLAMPWSIREAMIRFKGLRDGKTAHFILLDNVQLPETMKSLDKVNVREHLEAWRAENITNTDTALKELNRSGKEQTKYFHCELQILMHLQSLRIDSNDSLSPHKFIGCSKLSCYLCWELLKDQEYKTRGTHGKISENCAFPFPKSLRGTVSKFVELHDQWDSLFRRHKDGKFPLWDSKPDTDPAHTGGGEFNREIARARFQGLNIQGYQPRDYPFRQVANFKPKHGGFATVYPAHLSEAKDPSLSAVYALKAIIIKDMDKLDMTTNEIRILENLQHKNIVVLKEAFFDEFDPRKVYLGILPWVPMTLQDCFRSVMDGRDEHEWYHQGTLSHWPSIVVQCLEGLSYLHKKDTKHKDIKPYNILLQNIINNETGETDIRPIIADFNISKDQYDSRGQTESSGTIQFKAPEQFGTEPQKTLLSDIWSLGCCFAFIFILISSSREELRAFWDQVMGSDRSGFYNHDNRKELYRLINMKSGRNCDVSKAVFTQGLGELIKEMLQEEFQNRVPAEKALEHMRELEAHLSVLKLGLPKLCVCLTVKGQTLVKEIHPVELRPANKLIRHCVSEFRTQRHEILGFWDKRLYITNGMFVRIKSGHLLSRASTDTIESVENVPRVSYPLSELASSWVESAPFYHELLRLSLNNKSSDNTTWALELDIVETWRKSRWHLVLSLLVGIGILVLLPVAIVFFAKWLNSVSPK
ncbi:kinase-like domain-containing protein [Nemania sp. NC0429]|nr:kinase-like domain-containing protein [Nemania sp. NC0429]